MDKPIISGLFQTVEENKNNRRVWNIRPIINPKWRLDDTPEYTGKTTHLEVRFVIDHLYTNHTNVRIG